MALINIITKKENEITFFGLKTLILERQVLGKRNKLCNFGEQGFLL